MMISRRLVREKVLQILYAYEMSNNELEILYKELLKDISDEKQILFAKDLVIRVINHTDEFDKMIASVIKNWELDRMAVIDRILMRMAICEMLYFPDIPTKVSINEVIEIAKRFSTDESDKFINGVLDSILKKLKSENKIIKEGRGLVEESIKNKKSKKV